MVVCMKKEFSKNTTEVFTKTIFHYVPKILKYIDEIKDPRKGFNYSMRYLVISEMLMFLSEESRKDLQKQHMKIPTI